MMGYANPRIKNLDMSVQDIIVLLADGNPGAIRVLMELIQHGKEIDPDDALAPFGSLFGLDNLDCYGSRIWMFFKDVCGQDLHKMVALMRAVQLGYTSDTAINHAIDGHRDALDITSLLTQVKAQLPAFQIERSTS